MNLVKKILILLLCTFSLWSWGQTVTLDPTFSTETPLANSELTITYDVTGTDLESLDAAWLWLWLPDQNDASPPSNINPASSDADVSDPAKFTRKDDEGIITFSISLIISDFVDAPGEINEVGILLKADDWSGGQTTDFVFHVSEAGSGGETSGTHEIKPSISPEFPKADESITITFVTGGTELEGIGAAWLWLWLPDQTNADVASNVNPANSDPSATDLAKFTREVIDGEEAFSITLTLTDFTNKAVSDIQEVGILLKGNDWSNGQTSDFTFNVSDGFSMKVNAPEETQAFYNPGDQIAVDVTTSESATINISVDGIQQSSVTESTTLQYTHQVIHDGEVHSLVIEANNGTDFKTFTHSYTTTPKTPEITLPSGLVDGANYLDDVTSAYLVLTAPGKDHVFVLGSFNEWSLDRDFLMNRDGDQFWLKVENLTHGQEYLYQYLIDGETVIADPYTEKVISSYDDGQILDENRYPGLVAFPSAFTSGETAVLQTNKSEFEWEVTNFQKPEIEDLVIYELLIRDFTEKRTYEAVTERLDYLDSLGINAIELMPVMEYEGNLSWGYNPSYKFAIDKFYGTENDLKTLIDEAHKRGIAIILDIVLNHHFGRSPLVQMEAAGAFGPPTAENVWFNITPKHDFNVGFDFNHESPFTQDYVDRVVKYWIEEYKIDGYRFDLSKGFTQKNTVGNVDAWGQYDLTRINLLNRMADVIWETEPNAYVLLEHFAVNAEERDLSNSGMLLWSNTRFSNLDWQYHDSRGWQNPNNVNYLESHDEERIMWENRNEGSLQTRLDDTKVDVAFFLMVPGPKMIWQFGEFGYDEELNNDRLGIKPTHWEYLQHPDRLKLFGLYQSLINLKTQTEYLSDEYFSWNPNVGLRWINYEHPEVQISMIGNPTNSTLEGDPHFIKAGEWYNYMTEESITVEDPNASLTLAPGEFHIFTSEPIDNFTSIDLSNIVLSTQDKESDLIAFPNPFNDEFIIQSKSGIDKVTLRDISGQEIWTRNASGTDVKVNSSSLNTGIYFVEVLSGENKRTVKLIKQK